MKPERDFKGGNAMLRRVGYVLSGLPAAFLLFDAVGKLVRPEPVITATVKLGYPVGVILPLGIILLVSTIIYLIPRTAVLGAILLTGYLGGAVATHVRVSNTLSTGEFIFNSLFPVFFGVLLWGGLYLRDRRLRDLLPLREL